MKAQWVDNFEEKLWGHHTCDWDAGNRNPDYPYQLAVAYFNWAYDEHGKAIEPEESVEEAFERYLETLNES